MTSDKDSLPKLGGFPRFWIGPEYYGDDGVGLGVELSVVQDMRHKDEVMLVTEHKSLLEQARQADAARITELDEIQKANLVIKKLMADEIKSLQSKLAIAVEALEKQNCGCYSVREGYISCDRCLAISKINSQEG